MRNFLDEFIMGKVITTVFFFLFKMFFNRLGLFWVFMKNWVCGAFMAEVFIKIYGIQPDNNHTQEWFIYGCPSLLF